MISFNAPTDAIAFVDDGKFANLFHTGSEFVTRVMFTLRGARMKIAIALENSPLD